MTTITNSLRPGIYKHYKGNEYEVIDIAKHSETEELLVVYRPCYGEQHLWVRPLEMFSQSVIVDQQAVPRFTFLRTL